MGGQAIWAASMVVLDTPLATMGLGSTTPAAMGLVATGLGSTIPTVMGLVAMDLVSTTLTVMGSVTMGLVSTTPLASHGSFFFGG